MIHVIELISSGAIWTFAMLAVVFVTWLVVMVMTSN